MCFLLDCSFVLIEKSYNRTTGCGIEHRGDKGRRIYSLRLEGYTLIWDVSFQFGNNTGFGGLSSDMEFDSRRFVCFVEAGDRLGLGFRNKQARMTWNTLSGMFL